MMGSTFERGFTLVELLVSLLIFGMLSAAGVALLSYSVGAQDSARIRLDELSSLRRVGALIGNDLAQAAPRLWRDEGGAVRAAFIGGSGQTQGPALLFVRRGWENLDGSSRPSLQKVQYRLSDGRLERIGYPYVDGTAASAAVPLLERVRSLRLRYLGADGEWRERWDPAQPTLLPRAVEMVVDVGRGGSIRQLFLVGAAA
jgi:general secretion pathway protein J